MLGKYSSFARQTHTHDIETGVVIKERVRDHNTQHTTHTHTQVLLVFDALYCSDDGLVIFVLILRFVPCVLSFAREMCGCNFRDKPNTP